MGPEAQVLPAISISTRTCLFRGRGARRASGEPYEERAAITSEGCGGRELFFSCCHCLLQGGPLGGMVHNRRQLVGEFQRQRQYGQCGIGPATGREYGAAGHIEIGKAMDPTVAVYNTMPRARSHARGAHMVITANGMIADQWICLPVGPVIGKPRAGFQPPQIATLQFLIEDRHES